MNTLQSVWEQYQKLASEYKGEDPEKFAFYLGAVSAFDILMHASDLQEDAAAGMLDGIYEECRDFIEGQTHKRGERNEECQNGVSRRRN